MVEYKRQNVSYQVRQAINPATPAESDCGLINVLADAGVGNTILKNCNSIAIDCESVDCDYYDFLRHIPYAVNSYHGQYMMQYSWAEITTAVLLQLK